MMNKATRPLLGFAAIAAFAVTQACSSTPPKSIDVTESIKNSLKAAGLTDVSVSQDLDKGVVTLKGSVANDSDKAKAESLARAAAGNQVVGNEIAVLPPGGETLAKAVNADLDGAISKNLDAALLLNKMHDQVKYDVKSSVVTLTGEVNSQALRADAQRIAMAVPSVTQVVNKLDVKNQKATSSK